MTSTDNGIPASVPVAKPAPVAASTSQMAALIKALVGAQRAAKALGKAGHNSHHDYKYTTAEQMYGSCRELLHDHDLVVIPTQATIDGEGERLILRREYIVGHADGGTMVVHQDWPIVPERGRPVDKATASADTTSLSYFLRDLLLIPRVDRTDDMDHSSRDDGNGGPPEPPPDPALDAQLQTIADHLDRIGVPANHNARQGAIGKALTGQPRKRKPDTLTAAEATKVIATLAKVPTPDPRKANDDAMDGERLPDDPISVDQITALLDGMRALSEYGVDSDEWLAGQVGEGVTVESLPFRRALDVANALKARLHTEDLVAAQEAAEERAAIKKAGAHISDEAIAEVEAVSAQQRREREEAERGCYRKRRYGDEAEAKRAARGREKKEPGLSLRTYGCEHCGGWHLTSSPARAEAAQEGGAA